MPKNDLLHSTPQVAAPAVVELYDSFEVVHLLRLNKPGTAKVGAISKAQNLKGGPFGLCETPAGCKKF